MQGALFLVAISLARCAAIRSRVTQPDASGMFPPDELAGDLGKDLGTTTEIDDGPEDYQRVGQSLEMGPVANIADDAQTRVEDGAVAPTQPASSLLAYAQPAEEEEAAPEKKEDSIHRHDWPLEDLADRVQHVSARARGVAADARSAASESSARVVSDETVVSQYTAEHIAATTPHEEPYLKATVREATMRKEDAQAASAATQAAYNTAILKQKEEVANAAAWAASEVERKLADPMMKLQDWKMEVLHDPMSEAKIAAEKAAAPYREAVHKLHQRISEYTKRAEQLNSQAFGLQVAAKGTAGVAVAIQKKPTPAHWKTASTLMKNAQHMLMQAAVFSGQAKKLEINANIMELTFQAYQAGGEAAAQTAAHWYAPHLIAPPPNGGAIWAPPGPPIPFKLLQTDATTEVASKSNDAFSKTSSDATNDVVSKASSEAIKPHRKEGNPFQRRRVPV